VGRLVFSVRGSKVRITVSVRVRNDLKEEQNTIVQQHKLNPKKFGSTLIQRVNKLKKLGDLKEKDEQGNIINCNMQFS